MGGWVAVEVRQNKEMSYEEGEDPKHWYSGRTMTVSPERLAFGEDACEIGTVKSLHGPLSVPMRDIAGGGPEAFELPPEHRPVDYIAIHCARSLIGSMDGTDVVHDRGIKITWYVVVRSPSEIEMPFLGGSFIRFRKPSPTS